MSTKSLRNDLIKLAYEQPYMRDQLMRILKVASTLSPSEKEEEKGTEAPKGKRKGPPPKWEEFLKARYQGGKKKVPNPNSKTRDRYPQVSASTAMKDKTFFKRVMEEYKKWIKSTPTPAKSKEEAPSKAPDVKKPDDVKKAGFNLPSERFKGKKVWVGDSDEGSYVSDYGSEIDFGTPKSLKKKLTLAEVVDLAGATSSSLFSAVKVATSENGNIGILSYTYGSAHLNREVIYDGNGKYHIHNDTLVLPKNAPPGLGTRLFANQVAKAREMGNITHIDCNAYRSTDGVWVGYKVWPKMGYDGTIPTLAYARLRMKANKGGPEILARLKAIGSGDEDTKVSDFYKIEGGEAWWNENGGSFNATFDLTEGSQSLKIHDMYVAKKAKEAGQTVEEFMSKIAAKSKDVKEDKPGKGKGKDNVTLDKSDHKILDEIWKSMRK